MTSPEVEVYASECCGTLFVPGYGPDDIVDAVEGERLVLSAEDKFGNPIEDVGSVDPTEPIQMLYREIRRHEAEQFDAIRAGDCPCCGEKNPGLSLLFVNGGSDRTVSDALGVLADGE